MRIIASAALLALTFVLVTPSPVLARPSCDGSFENGCEWEVSPIPDSIYHEFEFTCPDGFQRSVIITSYAVDQIFNS